MPDANPVLTIALLLAAGATMQWLAWRVRIPAILFLLLAGFLIGPVLGVFEPEQTFGDLFRPIVSLAVGIILFEGGLTLRFDELRGVGRIVKNRLAANCTKKLQLERQQPAHRACSPECISAASVRQRQTCSQQAQQAKQAYHSISMAARAAAFKAVVDALKARGKTTTVVESTAGGLISSRPGRRSLWSERLGRSVRRGRDQGGLHLLLGATLRPHSLLPGLAGGPHEATNELIVH